MLPIWKIIDSYWEIRNIWKVISACMQVFCKCQIISRSSMKYCWSTQNQYIRGCIFLRIELRVCQKKLFLKKMLVCCNMQFRSQLETTNSRFWLVNILLRKFETLSKKEIKIIKTQNLWWKTTKKYQKSICKHI